MKLDLNCLKARTSYMDGPAKVTFLMRWEKARAGTSSRTARKTVRLEGETCLFLRLSLLPCRRPRAEVGQSIAVTGAY